ncbi:putative proline--tRNA ligase, mitochondrial [Habropoda laboriosa]|uniref:proline--tRNA ligase n=2 Tax=Habropoda laboriosa TaxID=597456 RepID=A0A0L7RJG8_9HYME|nr:putative proline--tRNA ligase, mitochondrial [Habropoda laboriosa]
MYAFLPLGLRVLNKLTTLVDNEMDKIGAQKLLLPALTPVHLWKKTDRFKDNATELFKVKDRFDKEYILSPTYEETICTLVSSIGVLSPKMLPLKLYQISNKWRDEMKPRLGFLRSREFVMKDLYTFDGNLNHAQETYASVGEAYENIFKNIGVSCIKAVGDPGLIGGSITHEYHYVSNIGEDIVCVCSSCQYAINKTMTKELHCPQCKKPFLEQCTAEVGHTFLLNTKYTEPLKVLHKVNNVSTPLVMGCFGLGLSRIFTVMIEVLSTKEELRWPKNLAPYTVCIIPPKKGSKAENGSQYVNEIIEILDRLNIDAILDDRIHLSIGNRFMHARVTGFPYAIIIGQSIMESPPQVEIHNINDLTNCKVPLGNISTYFNSESIKT